MGTRTSILITASPFFLLVLTWIFLVLSVSGSPVLLMTDALLFFLLGCMLFAFRRILERESFHIPLRQIRRRPLAMFSLSILVFYILVGFADSLHFRLPVSYQSATLRGQTLSVFDYLSRPMWERTEKTYSAPLAVRLYAKETIQLPDGSTIRDFPRLKIAGAHLENPDSERKADIYSLTFQAVLLGLGLMLSITALLAAILSRWHRESFGKSFGKLLSGKYEIPWRSILLATSLVALLLAFCIVFSGKYFLLGTDKVGQSVLYQSLKSIRTGLVIGSLTTLVMLPFAIFLGVSAGYFRGWIDDLIQYLYTTLSSIPGVLLIAAAVLLLQVYISRHEQDFDAITRSDLRLLFLCIILGVTSWTGLCRLLRAETLKLRELSFITAARSMGVPSLTILSRHIVPNIMHIVLIVVALDFSGLVLAEAVLSYVGVGVDPTMNSWGNMINQARLEMARDPIVWWSLTAAFIFMFILVLAANIFADAVRDAFDPRMRERA